MPTYDYVCTKCGHTFDYFQSMSSAALETCPDDLCIQNPKGHGEVIRKIGAGAGIIFNGSGFYLTDYKNAAAPTKSESSAKSSTSESAGSSSESSSTEKPTSSNSSASSESSSTSSSTSE